MSRTRVPTSIFSAYRYCLNEKHSRTKDRVYENSNNIDGVLVESDFSRKIEILKDELNRRNPVDLLRTNYLDVDKFPFLNILLFRTIIEKGFLGYFKSSNIACEKIKRGLLIFSKSEFEDVVYFLFMIKYDLVNILGEENRFLTKKILDLDYYSFLQEDIGLIKEMLLTVENLLDYEKYKINFLQKLATNEYKFNLIFYDTSLIEKMISNYFTMCLLEEEATLKNMLKLIGLSTEIELI